MSCVIKKALQERIGSVSKVSERFGFKRDGYYKSERRRKKSEETSNQVISMVKERRKDLPREGGRKLKEALREDFQDKGLKIGREKLLGILRNNGMLVYRKRSGIRTTNSYHHFHKYDNLKKDLKKTLLNQVWVCDITYIRLVKGFCYLVLITDAYSRKMVGHDVSDSLELARTAPGLVHHSDRGAQYCSNEYVSLLKKHQVQISMTEENHCYENAMAERVNGILKDEFYLDQCFLNVKLAKDASENAIDIYNCKRLHLSLDYKIPNDVYKITA